MKIKVNYIESDNNCVFQMRKGYEMKQYLMNVGGRKMPF